MDGVKGVPPIRSVRAASSEVEMRRSRTAFSTSRLGGLDAGLEANGEERDG
jgi:hypothetical protein